MQMDDRQRYSQWESGEGYNRYITAELESFRKAAWKRQILRHVDAGRPLDVLDVGTGPGFFACILAEEGMNVTGIDQSEGMLQKARENAARLGVSPALLRMDVNRWGFPDDIGRAAAMLARGDLRYSTGQVIMVDGGMLIERL